MNPIQCVTHTKHAGKACRIPVSLFQFAFVFRGSFVSGCDGISREPSGQFCAAANGQEMRIDVTAKAAEGHPSLNVKAMRDEYESVGKCFAGGDSMVLWRKALPELPLVAEENRDENCVNGASETTTVMMSPAKEAGESSC